MILAKRFFLNLEDKNEKYRILEDNKKERGGWQ
jgi:hypothetical protein